MVSKYLSHLRKSLSHSGTENSKTESEPSDACLVLQHEEQLCKLKQELGDVSRTLLSLNLDDKDHPMMLHTALESEIFDGSLKLKRILACLEKTMSPTTSDNRGIKLPKIDIPKLDRSILQRRTSWEQFSLSVHSCLDLVNSKKLVYMYLRQAVKDGSAKRGCHVRVTITVRHLSVSKPALTVPGLSTRPM